LCAQHPGKMWKLDKKLMKPIYINNSPSNAYHNRQYADLPQIFIQNASLEIAWSKCLEINSISGNKIIPFFTNAEEGFDINSELDFWRAKYLLKNNIYKLPKL